jgi:hypothetical protein
VIGGLDGFELVAPSRCRGIRVVSRSLLLQRCRSLFLVPSSSKCSCIGRGGLYAFSTNLNKKHGIFDIYRLTAIATTVEKHLKLKNNQSFCMYSRIPKVLPSGSRASAHQPIPGISIFGTTILPPNVSTFLLYSSTDSTEM